MLGQFSLTGVKIAVTGGSGFLGSYVVPQLLAAGANLALLSRSRPNIVDVNIIEGDCRDAAAVGKLLSGQDVLIHMAALLFGASWQDYLEANVKAVQTIIQASKKNPPKKVIFVSSLAAAGPCGEYPGIAESAIPSPVSAYGWSKLICENILSAHFQKNLVIIRPPIIYGAGDRGLLPLFKSVKKGLGISPGAFRKFPVSIIHARDCSRAILLCCEDRAEGIYHISDGAPCDMDKFCKAMASSMGKNRILTLHIPLAAMQFSAVCCSTWSIATKWIAQKCHWRPPAPPHWNMDKMREARQTGWLANSQRIAKELDFSSSLDLEAGMAQTVQGYIERGWL